ncbi:LysE/ArgO family amino acid transporter [Microlunatus ginsengisoli]|uniref:LysE/ArgO family amino acid transporter n=1 Tax=Microlunatus ginsengisoli TaxID=363863 RepID=A0ABP7AB34_9ACTN
MLDASLAGLLTGLSLIMAIGAQNAFLLRQGVRRSYVGVAVAVCVLSDVVLITAGVSGVGVLIQRADWLLTLARWLGAAFLVWYGLSSIRRALRPCGTGLDPAAGALGGPARVVRRTLALTWLNPHVYLDTVVLLGSIAAVHGAVGRWWFGGGAAVASVLWFVGLGFAARLLAPLLSSARAWRVLDVFVGATMLAIAVKLVLG